MKYRKKPVVIEAWEVVKNTLMPSWLLIAIDMGKVQTNLAEIHIHTLEGTMIAREGDFIIKGVQGELYPCKSDIFEQTYEKVE